MKRTFEDTDRAVVITIDNTTRDPEIVDQQWTAVITVDGEQVVSNGWAASSPIRALHSMLYAVTATDVLDDPVPVMPKDKTLTALVQQAADGWAGKEIPSWMTSEYLRGQIELILKVCDVRSPGEQTLDDVVAKDRVVAWIKGRVQK